MYWLSDRAADAGDALVRWAAGSRSPVVRDAMLTAAACAAILLMVVVLYASHIVLGDRR